MRHLLPAAGIALLLAFPAPAKAQDATECVRITKVNRYNEQTNAIVNRCGESIVVAWCGNEDARRTGARCGGNNYYTRRRVLGPNETYANSVGIPDGEVEFAACYGDRGSIMRTNSDGRFRCEDSD